MENSVTLHKDEVITTMRNASSMSMEELFAFYTKFVLHTENTPIHFDLRSDLSNMTIAHQRALHATMGLVTESCELLDEFKKHLYGKQRPLTRDAFIEEMGDVLHYFTLFMSALGIDFRELMKDNVTKIANRYLERFNV